MKSTTTQPFRASSNGAGIWAHLPDDIINKVLEKLTETPHKVLRNERDRMYRINPAVLSARLVSKSIASKLRWIVCVFHPDIDQYVKEVFEIICRTLESHPSYVGERFTVVKMSHIYTTLYKSGLADDRDDASEKRRTTKSIYNKTLELAPLEKPKLSDNDWVVFKRLVSNVFSLTWRHRRGVDSIFQAL